MTDEMQMITEIIEKGAKSAMTDEEIILQEIAAWESSERLRLMLTGWKYYRGDTDILQRKRMVIAEDGQQVEAENLANNKLVHNFIRKLTDQKVGYLLSKPMSIQTNNDDYQDLLSEHINKTFLRTLQNVGKEAICKGRAWIHIYYNEQGQLSFKRIPSQEIIPLWKDSAHTELDAVIRVYNVVAFEGREEVTITKVEYWDQSGVKRYVRDEEVLIPDVELGDNDTHYVALSDDQEIPLNWERVPFVCFKYNDEELPLIKFLKSLVDDYDRNKSDNSNSLEDMPNSIFVLKNYDGQDLGEFRKNLSVYRAVKVFGENGSEGGVDTLSIDINTEAYKTHMEMNRKDIYEFGRGVDTQSNEFGNSPTGIALRFLYADLDMDANIIETEFQASMEQIRWFIDQHIYNTTENDYSEETVDFIFNRDIIINETEAITNARNSVGILSDETIVANHPWTTNTKDELERKRKDQEAYLDPYDFQPPSIQDDEQ